MRTTSSARGPAVTVTLASGSARAPHRCRSEQPDGGDQDEGATVGARHACLPGAVRERTILPQPLPSRAGSRAYDRVIRRARDARPTGAPVTDTLDRPVVLDRRTTTSASAPSSPIARREPRTSRTSRSATVGTHPVRCAEVRGRGAGADPGRPPPVTAAAHAPVTPRLQVHLQLRPSMWPWSGSRPACSASSWRRRAAPHGPGRLASGRDDAGDDGGRRLLHAGLVALAMGRGATPRACWSCRSAGAGTRVTPTASRAG